MDTEATTKERMLHSLLGSRPLDRVPRTHPLDQIYCIVTCRWKAITHRCQRWRRELIAQPFCQKHPRGHNSSVGLPITLHILYIISASFSPGTSGVRLNISAIIAPIAHMSTALVYLPHRRITSGALYHLVQKYSV